MHCRDCRRWWTSTGRTANCRYANLPQTCLDFVGNRLLQFRRQHDGGNPFPARPPELRGLDGEHAAWLTHHAHALDRHLDVIDRDQNRCERMQPADVDPLHAKHFEGYLYGARILCVHAGHPAPMRARIQAQVLPVDTGGGGICGRRPATRSQIGVAILTP